MSKEEMISEIEIYLSHVIAKDFPLPKAIRLMYEEYKNSNKAWEKIYDEDQDYIGELNDKILDLEFKIKEQSKEIEELNKSDTSKEQSSMNYYNLYKELEDKIKAKIEELDKEYTEILKDYGNIDEDVIFQIENENVRKQLGEILSKIIVLQSLLEKE